MRAVDRSQFRLVNKQRERPKWLRIMLFSFGGVVGVFIIANLVMLLMYRGKVLPNYSVAAVAIGGTPYGKLDQKVPVEKLLPGEITLKKDDITKNITPEELGATVDWNATLANIKHTRNWLPLISFFIKHSVAAELTVDNGNFATAVSSLEKTFKKDALPQRVAFSGDNFAIALPEDGFTMDVVNFRADLLGALEHGKTVLAVPVSVQTAPQPTADLTGELAKLQKYLDAKITYTTLAGQSRQLTRSDIAGFFEPDGQTLKLSETKIRQVINGAAQGLGVTPVNADDAVQAAMYAINKKQEVTFRFAAQGVRIYHYCTALRDVADSNLADFRQKIAATYGDPRSWAHGGKIAFVYAESGCDLTDWLSSAAAMTTFSPDACDNIYSCTVPPNVIINYDRWMGATDPWNKAGGTIEDYRVMVIGHETGHWLGFNHRNCPGAGQPAPLMQQQSIDLQGCAFNIWPTPSELAAL